MSSSMDPSSGKSVPAAFRRVPGSGNETPGEEQDPQPEGNGEGPVTHEARHHVAGEPVALQGRDERLDAGCLVRGKRGIGHGQEGNGRDEGPQEPVPDSPLHDEVQKHDGPGKKDQRLVEIGKGRMPDAQPVGFPPAHGDAGRVQGKPDQGRPRGQLSPVLVIPQQADQVEGHGNEIDHRCPAEHLRVHSVSPL